MTEEEWDALPTVPVPVGELVFTLQNIDPASIWPLCGARATEPIRVERLNTGQYFIHNGRHRAIRAQLEHKLTIEAKVQE